MLDLEKIKERLKWGDTTDADDVQALVNEVERLQKLEDFKKLMAQKRRSNAMRVEGLRHSLQEYANDSKKEKRQSARNCKYCWYIKGSIATAAFTPYTCMACKEEKIHPTGAVPALCPPCADQYQACAGCGAEMD